MGSPLGMAKKQDFWGLWEKIIPRSIETIIAVQRESAEIIVTGLIHHILCQKSTPGLIKEVIHFQ